MSYSPVPDREPWPSRIRTSTHTLVTVFACLPLLAASGNTRESESRIVNTPQDRTVMIRDGSGRIAMLLDYSAGIRVRTLRLENKEVLGAGGGVWSGGELGRTTFRSDGGPPARVVCTESSVTITDIRPGGGIAGPEERWVISPTADRLRWRLERVYHEAGECDQALTPCWEIVPMSRWTGALLGTGGAAWFHLFDTSGATYGVHTSKVTLWHAGERAALRISAVSAEEVAVRLSRVRDTVLSIGWSVTPQRLQYRYDDGTHRRRFLTRRTDVWAPSRHGRESVAVEFEIAAVDFQEAYGWGDVPGFRRQSLEAFCQTISRIGVIDAGLHGTNSWRTPYGPACLHEPFVAQLGLIMQDPDYFRSYQQTLDNYRDHAIGADGRVKSRWAYTCEDAIPGTCDSLGFYEAQWGYLMDSNPDFVTNVSELFDFTGDRDWLQGQKAACERALEYLLMRDHDADGLVEMVTQSHTDARGSDWIDIIWAAHENAFVNAKMYAALVRWAECEAVLGDTSAASRFRRSAMRLKEAFNKSTRDGGFWDAVNRWYVHWRDRDGSIHGNNLVTFVNFQAIAYGLCDDPSRIRAVLDRIESRMTVENLFFWPICMFSYAPGEGLEWQWPFPNYENGDIFLSLGEVGTRAYAAYRPAIAMKYIRNLVNRYERDGLAFQRYRRTDQQGAGDDILAGNALGVVGLFRNIFGIQPKHNRLFLDPHLTPDLSGARLTYRHQDVKYSLLYDSSGVTASSGALAIHCDGPFGVAVTGPSLSFFQGPGAEPSMIVTPTAGELGVSVRHWQQDRREWVQSWSGRSGDVTYRIRSLPPGAALVLEADRSLRRDLVADPSGEIVFDVGSSAPAETHFRLVLR